MIRIAIVDDEKSWCDTLCGYLKRYFAEIGNDYVCDVFDDGIDLVSENRAIYDAVFLDIDMKLMNGVDAARKLRAIDKNVVIIFVTNLAQYAIKGYEVNAFDFIVKPLTYSAFFIKMKRIVNVIRQSDDKKVSIRCEGNTIILSARDIMYIEVLTHDIVFHTEDAEYRTYGSLKDFENFFAEEKFYRCYKSYLINLKYVSSVTETGVEIGRQTLPVSRFKRKELLGLVSKYIGGNL